MISLTKWRKSKKLSMQKLADMCGCNVNLIYRLESGAVFFSNLDENVQKRIADVLGSPVEAFYHDSEVNIYTSCKTHKMPLDELEKMLHDKYGDKIGTPKGRIKRRQTPEKPGRFQLKPALEK